MSIDPDALRAMMFMRSRLKMRVTRERAFGELFLAARYARSASELEDNLVEKYFLAAEAALLDIEALVVSRPDLALSIEHGWERLLADHKLQHAKKPRKRKT